MASSFRTPLRCEDRDDGCTRMLLEPFTYYLGTLDSDVSITVPAGFVCDGSSIPPFLWPVLGSSWGKAGKPGVLHDFLYRHGQLSRRMSDLIHLEANRVAGVRRWRRVLMYAGLRLFGFWTWRRYRRRHPVEDTPCSRS